MVDLAFQIGACVVCTQDVYVVVFGEGIMWGAAAEFGLDIGLALAGLNYDGTCYLV